MRYKTLLIAASALFIISLSGCFATVPASSTTTYTTTAPASTSSTVVYQGAHPVYVTHGSQDWCPIHGVHSHAYSPSSMDFYVRQQNRLIFIGDPTYYVRTVNFNTYAYMDPHPHPYGGWCYIQGPHYHTWEASGYYNYVRRGNYNYYSYYGPRDRYYVSSHRHYRLNDYYRRTPPPRYRSNYGRTYGMRHVHPTSGPNSYSVYRAPNARTAVNNRGAYRSNQYRSDGARSNRSTYRAPVNSNRSTYRAPANSNRSTYRAPSARPASTNSSRSVQRAPAARRASASSSRSTYRAPSARRAPSSSSRSVQRAPAARRAPASSSRSVQRAPAARRAPARSNRSVRRAPAARRSYSRAPSSRSSQIRSAQSSRSRSSARSSSPKKSRSSARSSSRSSRDNSSSRSSRVRSSRSRR